MADDETKPSGETTTPETLPVDGTPEVAPPAEQAAQETPSTPEPEMEPETPASEPPEQSHAAPGSSRLKRLFASYWHKKKWTIPVTILAIVIIILAIPYTRYNALGLVLKKPVVITVVDSKTGTPVSAATISLAGQTFKTDGTGKATQKLKLGSANLLVAKQYYTQASKSVTIALAGNDFKIELAAIGRQVPLTVLDKVSGQPLANAVIKVLNTEAKTDKSGKAILVLPTAVATQKATITRGGYNDASVAVQVTDKVIAANSFSLTPAGKIYFLSNQSGKIDVVKANLDGSARQTVLAGTGSEEPNTTSLLASRDWKYLALLSKRSGNNASIYLIDTSNDKLTTMDEGNANFTLVGWNDDSFVYQVLRNGVQNWQPNAQAIKSYNAQTGKLTVLDQTTGEGSGQYDYGYTAFNTPYLLDGQVVYAKNWYGSGYLPNHLAGKTVDLLSIKPDGSGKKVIKSFPVPDGVVYGYSVDLTLYAPNDLYIRSSDAKGASTFYEFEDNAIKTASDVTDTTFYNQTYPTFLQSPSGTQTFWSDQRDGKNALFVGDKAAKGAKQIASLSEYNTYGWFTDGYLLVSKNSSELYIMSVSGADKPLKITDYYKPPINYRGYGGGYGGL